MSTELENKCIELFEKLDNENLDFESFKKGFEACHEYDIKALPDDYTLKKFMAISNMYALGHPGKWSIKELTDFIKGRWNHVN